MVQQLYSTVIQHNMHRLLARPSFLFTDMMKIKTMHLICDQGKTCICLWNAIYIFKQIEFKMHCKHKCEGRIFGVFNLYKYENTVIY